MINLMIPTLKTFLKIIHEIIYRKLPEQVRNTQFRFRNRLGTRKTATQILIRRVRDINTDVFPCFINFTKAFDNVIHLKLIAILKITGIDET